MNNSQKPERFLDFFTAIKLICYPFTAFLRIKMAFSYISTSEIPTFSWNWRNLKLYISNDDGDGNENVKKAIVSLSKKTTLNVHHAFLYIFLPSLHDYDVEMCNATLYGGRKQATTNSSFTF